MFSWHLYFSPFPLKLTVDKKVKNLCLIVQRNLVFAKFRNYDWEAKKRREKGREMGVSKGGRKKEARDGKREGER